MKEDNVLNIPHHTQPPVKLPLSSPPYGPTILNKIQMQVNSASNPTTAAINGNNTQTNKGGYKIVVNNYHAHSILSTQDNNNITTCLINTPALDASAKLYQQIGDTAMLTSKHKNVDNFYANIEKPKSKASNDNELETIKDVPSNENMASAEDSSTPNETTPPPPPKSVIMIQSNPQKCEVTGEDDIGSNLDDDDDEDLGGEFFVIFFFTSMIPN